jgi:hypothetical protein
MGWKIPYCNDCGETQPKLFMLKHELWLSIAKKQELLCLTCAEHRLGRKLTMDDFLPSSMCTDGVRIGVYISTGVWPKEEN